ncbi:MAG: type IV pilin protein [Candidatus Nitrosoglobus sp.]
MYRRTGFTLIEMLIVMAIVAILATVALPSYQGVVRQSRRSEAIMTLLEIQLKEEKWRANHSAYGSISNVGGITSNDYYNFAAEDTSTSTYTLKAAAKTGTDQINDKENGTGCSTLTINQSGEKTPAQCWK